MPRYYFRIISNGQASPQTEGLDLPDNAAAWEEATTASGEMIRSLDGSLKPGTDWQMDVTDDAGRTIYSMNFVTKSFV